MKYIKKGKEPKSLTVHRDHTVGSKYEAKPDWRKGLCKEQGYICAYCMKRIEHEEGKSAMQIEHYISRRISKHENLNLDLRWENMLGVCNGISGKESHCDKVKEADKLNLLNPLNTKQSEVIITYSLFGEILPNTQDEDLHQKIAEDLDCILNLNNEKLRDYRRETIDRAKEILKEKYPNGNWTLVQIDQEIEYWKTKKDGKYQPFCQAAIWFLEKRKSKLIRKS
jgi:uncharacterized protein (TIGR02646 family)